MPLISLLSNEFSITKYSTSATSGSWSCPPNWLVSPSVVYVDDSLFNPLRWVSSHYIVWLIIQITDRDSFQFGRQTWLLVRFLPFQWFLLATLYHVGALFNTLHSTQYAGMGKRGGISRERFFLFAFLGSFSWYFMPGYLFQALSYFSWVCWIAPDNIKVNQMFGVCLEVTANGVKTYTEHSFYKYRSGLGMSLLTFDWAQVLLFISNFCQSLSPCVFRLHMLSRHWLHLGGLRPMSHLHLYSSIVSNHSRQHGVFLNEISQGLSHLSYMYVRCTGADSSSWPYLYRQKYTNTWNSAYLPYDRFFQFKCDCSFFL